MPAAPAPDLALVRALELGAVAVAGTGGAATLLTLAVGGRAVSAGVAAGGVLALAFMWVTRVAVLRARVAPVGQVAAWVLGSYVAKTLLVLATTALAVSADDVVDRRSFGVTLLVGVVVSVVVQTTLSRPSRTATLDLARPASSVPAGAGSPHRPDKVAAR